MLTLKIGPVPNEEVCPALSDPQGARTMLLGTTVYCRMLSRRFPVPPNLLAYFLTMCETAGGYPCYTVALVYDGNNPAGEAFARTVDAAIPHRWDEQARLELDWYCRSLGYYQQVVEGWMRLEDIPAQFRGLTPFAARAEEAGHVA